MLKSCRSQTLGDHRKPAACSLAAANANRRMSLDRVAEELWFPLVCRDRGSKKRLKNTITNPGISKKTRFYIDDVQTAFLSSTLRDGEETGLPGRI